jgi:anti-sigma factor RsiW
VECSRPGAITAEEILAYVDGEALAHVAAHLETCPACAALAEDYDHLQRRLGQALRRFDCPASQRLGDYALDLLAPEERTRVAAHVRDCPRCADELGQLREFLALEAAPPPVSPGERVRRFVARLVEPAPGLAYAGLRGAGPAAPRAYRAEGVTITVSVGPAAGWGAVSVDGWVWQEGGAPDAVGGATVTLTALADPARSFVVAAEELGSFVFEEVPPDTYRLEVPLGDRVIAIESLPIGR